MDNFRMKTTIRRVLISFVVSLRIIALGYGYIRFSPDYAINDVSNITDSSLTSCVEFHGSDYIPLKQFTTFRFRAIANHGDYINVTLVGKMLGCRYNLYVIPLSKTQTESWQGIWLACDLQSTSTVVDKDVCTFRCYCGGGCDEIQITKRPRKPEESKWSLCLINVTSGKTISFFHFRFSLRTEHN